MSDLTNAGRRFRGSQIVSTASHKYAVGASVTCAMGYRSEKALFRVVRHLPDGGQGLQYRLKSVSDGHERMAFEAALENPPTGDLAK